MFKKNSKCVIVFWKLATTVWVLMPIGLSFEICVICILANRTDVMTYFFIKSTSQFIRQSSFHVSYAACCSKDSVDFQIDLFIKTDSFPLRPIDCRNSWARQQQYVDFNYRDMYSTDSDMFDSNDDENVELVKCHAFSSSLCWNEI